MTASDATAIARGRVFLSYNSRDYDLARGLAESLAARTCREVFLAPKDLVAGGFWLPQLADEIGAASGFVLLVGSNGLGLWQVQEYYAAFDRRVKEPDFTLLVVLLPKQPAPGLPFINQLHWTVTADPTSEDTIGRLVAGLAGGEGRPTELWRHTSPYQGLLAMTEADSAFFFGRDAETEATLKILAGKPDRLPMLVGNSGVGKSSVAQAGVIAALKRQGFASGQVEAWPARFADSRSFAYLKMTPGKAPLGSLVASFLQLWELDDTDPATVAKEKDWIAGLKAGTHALADLLTQTERRLDGLERGRPKGFVLYVDQGEELYAQADPGEGKCFSRVLAAGLGDPRIFALMSLRADFLGSFQADEPLFARREQIDVPPLRRSALLQVVSRPATLLGARFADPNLPAALASRAEEDSASDAGALPLLSYLLDDMWSEMRSRGDGTLLYTQAAIDLGRVLVERADRYLETRPDDAEPLRRILTLKLATVREDGEPTRRKALRSEFSDAEWRIVCALADHPHRLLVTAAPDDGEATAEIAHEAIFRHWGKLRDWIVAAREFLIWKARLEGDRRRWETLPASAKADALPRGHALAQAETWLAERPEDLSREDRTFLGEAKGRQSAERRSRQRRRNGLMAALAVLAAILAIVAWWGNTQRRDAEQQTAIAEERAREAEREKAAADREKSRAEAEAARAEDRTADAEQAKAEAERTSRAAKRAANDLVFQLVQRLDDRGLPLSLIHSVLSPAETLINALVESAPEDKEMLRLRSVMNNQFGNVLWAAGDKEGALGRYERGLEIVERLSGAEPNDAGLAHDISVSLIKIGDVLLARNDLDDAFARYERALAILKRLWVADRGRLSYARDAAMVISKIGDIFWARGNLDDAFARYETSLSLREGLSAADPNNADLAREVSISLEKVGRVLLVRGNAEGAQANYERSLATLNRVAAANPDNSQIARDVAVTLEELGDLLIERKDLKGALVRYQQSLAILERLSATDPENRTHAHRLAQCLQKIGDVLRTRGDLDGALASYERSLSIFERIAKSDASFNQNVSSVLSNIADVFLARRETDRAQAYYMRSLAIRERFLAADPENPANGRLVALSLGDIALAERQRKNTSAACRHLARGRAILITLRDRLGKPKYILDDLAWFDLQLRSCPLSP